MSSGRRDRRLDEPGSLWRSFTKASVLVFAVVFGAIVALVAGGLLVWRALESEFPSADPKKARAEVQAYYDARFPGRVDVTSCKFAPLGDSDFDSFACSVEVECRKPIYFSVPRAGETFRDDRAPVEYSDLRPKCPGLPKPVRGR